MKLNQNIICFTGGGTGGHIYPGLAVADELKNIARADNKIIKIYWIGCSKGMDRNIVEKAIGSDGKPTADKFYGIPSGKLRRYFSMKNFSDLFRIFAGFVKSLHVLRKVKPCLLFSKGGFVSVPPCLAARILKIPVYTHECDFTLGLANRINFKSAKKMFVSYEETKNKMSQSEQNRVIVTGNPVRPIFYNTDVKKGYDFLGIDRNVNKKDIILVLGGSSGAKQVNDLIFDSLDYLCKDFIVVHQTGLINGDDSKTKELEEKYKGSYKAYNFIYDQMPDVLACSDLIISRAGANSLWEAAVLLKPMILIPLCGSGTRGDQVDNARYFAEKNAAQMLLGSLANKEGLINAVENMKTKEQREKYAENLKKMLQNQKASQYIAQIIYKESGGNI